MGSMWLGKLPNSNFVEKTLLQVLQSSFQYVALRSNACMNKQTNGRPLWLETCMVYLKEMDSLYDFWPGYLVNFFEPGTGGDARAIHLSSSFCEVRCSVCICLSVCLFICLSVCGLFITARVCGTVMFSYYVCLCVCSCYNF